MKTKVLLAGLLLSLLPISLWAESLESMAAKNLLPSPFPVYTQGTTVINHPYPGMQQKMLPTNNDFTGNPGCYVACYSHDSVNGIYQVGLNIFVNGQIRVPGTYEGRMCKPTGYENADLNKEKHFAEVCQKISTCKDGKCFAGGDTGGWFGIQ